MRCIRWSPVPANTPALSFADAQGVAVCDKDEQAVAQAVPAQLPGGIDQALHFRGVKYSRERLSLLSTFGGGLSRK